MAIIPAGKKDRLIKLLVEEFEGSLSDACYYTGIKLRPTLSNFWFGVARGVFYALNEYSPRDANQLLNKLPPSIVNALLKYGPTPEELELAMEDLLRKFPGCIVEFLPEVTDVVESFIDDFVDAVIEKLEQI